MFIVYLSFIAHWDLNKDHWEVGSVFKIEFIVFELRFDLFKLDPEATETEDQPIKRLDQEEDSAELGESDDNRSDVIGSKREPSHVRPLDKPTDLPGRSVHEI